MKRLLITLLSSVVLLSFLLVNAYAAIGTNKPWPSAYPTPTKAFTPKAGSAQATYNTSTTSTKVKFKLSSANVTEILKHNNGTHSTNYPGMYLFFGLDIKNNNWGNPEKMSAYAISSNLPGAVTDLENDNPGYQYWQDLYNEESEVVATGTVVANTEYHMTTTWNDLRGGGQYDSGAFQVTFHMSGQYIGGWFTGMDYNTFIYEDIPDATMYYGNYRGREMN